MTDNDQTFAPDPDRPAAMIADLAIDADIEDLFTYHAPDGGQKRDLERVRRAAMHLAQTIRNHTPPSANQTIAMQHVVDARMRANAAIATRGANFGRPLLTVP